MRKSDILEQISLSLAYSVDGLTWDRKCCGALCGTIKDTEHRLYLWQKSDFCRFGWKYPCDSNPENLVTTMSSIWSNFRYTWQNPAAKPKIVASWPSKFPPEEQADILASDMKRRLSKDSQSILFKMPVTLENSVKQRLKNIICPQSAVRQTPSNGRSWDFAIGHGSSATQISVRQKYSGVLSFTTLITNWSCADTSTERATSLLMLMLNARLLWVRLIRQGSAVDAEVSMPVEALTEHTWRLAYGAMSQAIVFCRKPLRVVQLPSVAQAFEQVHMKKNFIIPRKFPSAAAAGAN